MMEVSATLRYARGSAQKYRLVADQIRGLNVAKALDILHFSGKKAARFVMKVLNSAIANAEHNEGADIDSLEISQIFINEGPTMKRIQTRARGRSDRLLRRTCHITVAVSDELSKEEE